MSTAGRQNREAPTFFVIGAAKCGTTSLHSYLDLHPEISMSKVKEPLYFCAGADGLQQPVISDWDEYLGLFGDGTRHRGEASIQYSNFALCAGVPEAIQRRVSAPKFIYLVRDPIHRILAAAQEELASRYPKMSWRSRKGRDGSLVLTGPVGPLDHPANPLTGPGLYMTQLRAYLDRFPAESILVVDADRLRGDRRKTMAEIFSFLEVEPFYDPVGMGVELNRGDAKARASRLHTRLAAVPVLRRGVERLPQVTRTRLALGARRAGGRSVPKPEIDAGIRSELEDLFRPEVEELREFTGKPFSSWSI